MAISAGVLIAGALISALVSAVSSGIQNSANIKAQQSINNQNVEAQKEVNQQNIEYSREFAQNGISWKVEDLQNAGLNPTLAAGMSGVVSQPTAMSAPQQKAPMMDLSGISSAITAMNNMMLTSYLMNQRNEIASDRNTVMREKNDVLSNLYRRKGLYLESSNEAPLVMNAKQMQAARKKLEDDMTPESKSQWDKIMKDLNASMPKVWKKKGF